MFLFNKSTYFAIAKDDGDVDSNEDGDDKDNGDSDIASNDSGDDHGKVMAMIAMAR